MLNQPTLEKLHALRLGPMADAWQAQQRDTTTGALSFDERFAMLVDAEYLARDNRRLARLLKDADLRIPGACIEDVDTAAARGVDRAMLRQRAMSVTAFSKGHAIEFSGVANIVHGGVEPARAPSPTSWHPSPPVVVFPLWIGKPWRSSSSRP